MEVLNTSTTTPNITDRFTRISQSLATTSHIHTIDEHVSDLEPFEQSLGILLTLSVTILIENGCIILAFLKDKELRKRSANILVFSQATADYFTGLIFIPTYLIEKSLKTKHVTPFFICYMLFISLLNLFALALDRFLALRKPFLHHRMMSSTRTIKVLVTIWVIPLFLSLLPLCWWFESDQVKRKAFNIYLSVGWSLMLLLVLTMTVMYVFVTKAARRTIRQRKLSLQAKSKTAKLAKKELRVAHLFGWLLFFFVIAYFPILYINLCDIIGKKNLVPRSLETVSFYFLILNSVVNPLLCISLKKDYQIVIMSEVFRKRRVRRRLSSRTTVDYDDEERSHFVNNRMSVVDHGQSIQLPVILGYKCADKDNDSIGRNSNKSPIMMECGFNDGYAKAESRTSLSSPLVLSPSPIANGYE